MKKVLIIGDSITEGVLGASYIKLLRQGTSVKNAGFRFDTCISLLQRLKKLKHIKKYDTIIVQIGTNDILIPELRRRGLLWSLFIQLAHYGNPLTSNEEDIHKNFEEIIKFIQSKRVKNIYCLNIIPIGENLNSELNKKVSRYNMVIKEVCNKYRVKVIDINSQFTNYLKSQKLHSSYLIDSLIYIAVDFLISKFEQFQNMYTEKRRLHLTIDGVHLNKKGAMLYSRTIIKKIHER